MLHIANAVTAGLVTPQNDEALSPGGTEGLKDNAYQRIDFTQSDDWMQSEDSGRMAWLSQQFEKVGLNLYRLGDTTLMVTSMGAGLAQHIPDLRSARAFLSHVGGGL